MFHVSVWVLIWFLMIVPGFYVPECLLHVIFPANCPCNMSLCVLHVIVSLLNVPLYVPVCVLHVTLPLMLDPVAYPWVNVLYMILCLRNAPVLCSKIKFSAHSPTRRNLRLFWSIQVELQFPWFALVALSLHVNQLFWTVLSWPPVCWHRHS